MSRVLIVEDDPHILRVISLWLSRQGHTIVESRNGLSALDQYRQHRPDVLITDINMPGMDGLRLLDHVLHEPPVPRAIVVLTNRWDHHEMGERMAQAGVHVVPKPFSPSKLSEMIESLVPTDASAQAPKGAGPQTESSL